MKKWLDKYNDDVPQAQNGIEGTMGGLTDQGFNYNGAWGGTMQMGGNLPGSVGFMYAHTQNPAPSNGPYAKKTKASAQDGIKKPLVKLSPDELKMERLKQYAERASKKEQPVLQSRSSTPDDVRNQFYNWRKAEELLNKGLGYADVITDVMQTGNFIPNPIGQVVGKIGNMLGSGVDAFQAGMETRKGNYGNAAINAASVALPTALGFNEFRRNSKYLQPGQPLYPLSPQANIPSGTMNIPRVNYIEPFTKVKGMTDANLMTNRALLGTLGAETVYDSYQNGGEIILKHSPSDKGYYELSKTVTPYKSKKQIKQNVKAPTSPKDVNFISNYRGALGDINEYPTAVPFEGEKHWNIDRFIIDPAFSHGYANLKSNQSDKDLKLNVLSDMYKYNMLQGKERDDAFKNAKKFIRKEINPRINNSFFKDVILSESSPYSTAIDKFADNNPVLSKRLTDIYIEENPNSNYNKTFGKAYADNPWSESKNKRVIMDYLKDYKKMSSKDAKQQYNRWKKEANKEEASYREQSKNRLSLKEATGSMEVFENGGEMKFYQEGLDWKPKNISQDGIKVDPMGYWNPDNVGEPVIIPSNEITMEGVYEPLIGVSDTGDVQYMEPGGEYEFDGESVTEYPIAQSGKKIKIPMSDFKKMGNSYLDSVNTYDYTQALWDAVRTRNSSAVDQAISRNKNLINNTSDVKPTSYDNVTVGGKNYRIPSYKYPEMDPWEKYEPVSGFWDNFGYKLSDINNAIGKTNIGKSLQNVNDKLESGVKKIWNKFTDDYVKNNVKNQGALSTVNKQSVPLKTPPTAPPVVSKSKPKPKPKPIDKPIDKPSPKPISKSTVESKKEQPLKKEQPKPVERKQNVYEGSPVYSPGIGSGLPSALVGFANQKGDTTYIKPEDYERFAVPKYAKEYIETKKQKNGGWLDKYN